MQIWILRIWVGLVIAQHLKFRIWCRLAFVDKQNKTKQNNPSKYWHIKVGIYYFVHNSMVG
jgi:hypothetical protein